MGSQILDLAPEGVTLRPEQAQVLLDYVEARKRHDVICVRAPTGVGKTIIEYVIAKYEASLGNTANICVQDNLMVEQYLEALPNDLVVLHKASSYKCDRFAGTCGTRLKRCKGCVYNKAKRDIKKAQVRLMNYYIYLANRLYGEVVIFDEAHKLTNMLQDKRSIKIWSTQYKFPDKLELVSDVVAWIHRELAAREDKKLRAALREIIQIRKEAVVQYRREKFYGEYESVLYITPTSNINVPTFLWPKPKVKKIVLCTATIDAIDLVDMGIDGRKVCYLDCDSPIPVENRRIIYDPKTNMAYKYLDQALPLLAREAEAVLAQHPHEKGIVHLPYGLAKQFRTLVSNDRFMFHESFDKRQQVENFKNSDPADGRVLVASGLYEGMDFPYDAARFQIIGRMPYLSIGDVWIKAKSEQNESWYKWQAIKLLLQAMGRATRSADDFSTTYIFDRQFEYLLAWDKQRIVPMFPEYMRKAIINKQI